MTVTSEASNGIPNPDRPGYWIVPPWQPGASLCAVVRHVLLLHPFGGDTSTAYRLAYYRGCQAAIEAASTHELTDPCAWRWYQDLRDCVARCVAIYAEKRAAEMPKAGRGIRQLHPPAPATRMTAGRQTHVS